MATDIEDDEDSPNVQLACVGLDTLTLSLVLHKESLQAVHKDKAWREFIVDLILICRNR